MTDDQWSYFARGGRNFYKLQLEMTHRVEMIQPSGSIDWFIFEWSFFIGQILFNSKIEITFLSVSANRER